MLGLVVCMVLLLCQHVVRGLSSAMGEKIYYGATALTNLLAPQDADYLALEDANNFMEDVLRSETSSGVATSRKESVATASESSAASGSANMSEDEGLLNDANVTNVKDEEEII
jgi:hypothetical protein